MQLRWVRPQEVDAHPVDTALAVLEAARCADSPHELPLTRTRLLARLQHGWDEDPPELVLAQDDSGRVVGLAEVSLPVRDNNHLGFVELTVDPSVRRKGLGRALFAAAVERIREDDRTLVVSEFFDHPHGRGFATAMGLEPAMASAQRRLDVWRLPRGRLEELWVEARDASADYELLRLTDTVPEELVPGMVAMTAAINDAPLDELRLEDEVFSPERLAGFRRAQAAAGRRIYQLVARHRVSGELAGHTVVGVEGEQPYFAQQFDTSVVAAHRGHRLGMTLKAGMLRWLADAQPALRTIDTWNASSNAHMLAVNEALGFRVVATATVVQREVADLPSVPAGR